MAGKRLPLAWLLILLGAASLLLLMARTPASLPFALLEGRVAPGRSAGDVVNQAWQRAQAIGVYHYATTIEQTTHPLPMLENVGLGPSTDNLYVEGTTNLPEQQMTLALWSAGGHVGSSTDRLEMRVEEGKVLGRVGESEWQEREDSTDLFAPGGDALAYLAGATAITEVGTETRDPSGAHLTFTRYAFTVDGPAFATHIRIMLEAEMRRSGELPASIQLGLADHYVGMSGQGESWVDGSGSTASTPASTRRLTCWRFAP
ncbi:MAG: hypothetical protein ACRDIB_09640 [Ardenticatenaceae bacterium]